MLKPTVKVWSAPGFATRYERVVSLALSLLNFQVRQWGAIGTRAYNWFSLMNPAMEEVTHTPEDQGSENYCIWDFPQCSASKPILLIHFHKVVQTELQHLPDTDVFRQKPLLLLFMDDYLKQTLSYNTIKTILTLLTFRSVRLSFLLCIPASPLLPPLPHSLIASFWWHCILTLILIQKKKPTPN